MLNIALAQTYPRLGQLQKNTEHISAIVEKTIADIVVFPELAGTGYILKDQVQDLSPQATTQLQRICELSQSKDIVFGGLQTTAERTYNAAYYLSQGQIIHTHRKLYLPTYGMFDEKRYFSEGNQIRAFDTRFGRMAILICEDAWHLSSGYLAALDGTQYLIIISASPYREGIAKTWKDICTMHAQAFALNVIYCNRVGIEDGLTFWGGSMVIGPDGKVLAEAPQLEETVLQIKLDEKKLQQRQYSAFVRDEKRAVVLKELERLWRHEL